jgi:bla regulator protein blaR1
MPALDTWLMLAGHHLWQGAVLCGAAAAVAGLRLRWTAAQRVWIWTAAVAGMTLLPLSAFAPQIGSQGLKASFARASLTGNARPESGTTDSRANANSGGHAAGVGSASASVAQTLTNVTATVRALRDRATAFAASPLARSLAGVFVLLWIAGTAWRLLRLGFAWAAVRRMLRSARRLPVAHTAMPARMPVGVAVLVSERATVPMALGLTRPCVVLPERLVREADPSQVRHVIAHELAHVERGDLKALLIERVLLAIFWWSPLLHAAMRRLHEAREMACDDRAAGEAGDASAYVDALLGCAETLAAPRGPATILATGAFHDTAAFARRLRRLVSVGNPRDRGAPGVLLATGALAAVALFAVIFAATPRRVMAAAPAPVTPRASIHARGPRPDPRAEALGRALVEAAKRADAEGVDALLAAGADPDFALGGDGTALIVAVRAGSADIVDRMLAAGAGVDVPSGGDGNPLIMAAAFDRRDLARLLIQRGADVNAIVSEDETPLINAAREGHLDMVRLLVERGADPNLAVTTANGERRSPLRMALRGRHRAVAAYLRSKGAVR